MSGDALTRREFVAGSLAVGFAAAVRPVAAETLIATDSTGLVSGEVRIPVSGTELPAFRAMPDSGRRVPRRARRAGESRDHEHIRDVCRRLAKAGHLAIAPELYARQGDVSKMTDVQEIVTNVVAKVPDAQVMADLDATVAWAKASGGGDTTRLGITGFCWGGRIVWLYAAHNPALRAGVAWYGRLVGPTMALQPKNPIDIVKDLKVPVLGLYGGADPGIPPRVRRPDARGAEGRRGEVGDRGVSGRSARLLRRLPPDVSRGRGAGRLETPPRVVSHPRRGVKRPGSAPHCV